MSICLYDRTTNAMSTPYYLEHGERFAVDTVQLNKGLNAHVIQTREPLVINRDLLGRAAEFGSRMVGDLRATRSVQSYVGVPILKGDEARGVIVLYSYQIAILQPRPQSGL